MAYSEIANTSLDANSGLIETVTLQINANLIDHETRIDTLENYHGSEVVTVKTSDYTITPTEANGDRHFINDGASGTVIFSLPTALASQRVTISNLEAQTIQIAAATGDIIYTVEAPAGTQEVVNATQGSTIVLWCANATEWVTLHRNTFSASGRSLFGGGLT